MKIFLMISGYRTTQLLGIKFCGEHAHFQEVSRDFQEFQIKKQGKSTNLFRMKD